MTPMGAFGLTFVIRVSTLIRHSDFAIRHYSEETSMSEKHPSTWPDVENEGPRTERGSD